MDTKKLAEIDQNLTNSSLNSIMEKAKKLDEIKAEEGIIWGDHFEELANIFRELNSIGKLNENKFREDCADIINQLAGDLSGLDMIDRFPPPISSLYDGEESLYEQLGGTSGHDALAFWEDNPAYVLSLEDLFERVQYNEWELLPVEKYIL